MYLYQPCLLTMALYAWAFRKERWYRILAPLAILAISEWEVIYPGVRLYPASLLLSVFCLAGRVRSITWAEVLTSSLLGGLLGWKAADKWPLLPGLTALCALLALIVVVLMCQEREDRPLAMALGGLFFESFFCLKEYILFSFCVIRLGSRDALSLSTAAMCLYAVFQQGHLLACSRKKHAAAIGN